MEVPLSAPDITKKEIEAVLDVLRSNYLSLGPKLSAFEEAIASYSGASFAVAVNSGTSALHLIVRGLGIGPGDEVITTPFSFVASSNCLLFERAVPVFVDIDPNTLNIAPEKVESAITSRTKAVLAVDVFGLPADYDALVEITTRHNILLIEDSCEALGSTYKGQMAGTFGIAGAYAFYPNKQITAGEGGVVITDDEQLAAACRSMRNQGRDNSGDWLAHQRLGFNYRLDEMSCALALAQLERLDEILQKRSQVAEWYNNRLRGLSDVATPCVPSNDVEISWFVYVVRLSPEVDRQRVLSYLNGHGVQSKAYFPPIHLQPFYRSLLGYKEGDFPVTEQVAASTVALPFFTRMTEDQVEYVCQVLQEAICKAHR